MTPRRPPAQLRRVDTGGPTLAPTPCGHQTRIHDVVLVCALPPGHDGAHENEYETTWQLTAPQKRSYIVRVAGCDASNTILIDLNPTEAAAIHRLTEALNASSRVNCEPQMRIVAEADATPDDREWLDRMNDEPL